MKVAGKQVSDKERERLGMIALKAVWIFILKLSGTVLHTYVFSVLWGWFVVPIFVVSILQFWSAFGLLMTAKFLSIRFDNIKETTKKAKTIDDDKEVVKEVSNTKVRTVFSNWIAYPLAAWGIGYLVYTFGVM